MGINFGCCDAGVAKQFLYIAEANALFQKMGGKTVPEAMGCGVLFDFGLLQSLAENLFNTGGTVLSSPLPFE